MTTQKTKHHYGQTWIRQNWPHSTSHAHRHLMPHQNWHKKSNKSWSCYTITTLAQWLAPSWWCTLFHGPMLVGSCTEVMCRLPRGVYAVCCCDCCQYWQTMDHGLLDNDFVCLTSDSWTTIASERPLHIVLLPLQLRKSSFTLPKQMHLSPNNC